jgi:hypothetical protein
MGQINHQDAVVTARDTLFGDDAEDSQTGTALPFGQDEVDELLYSDGLPRAERLERLTQLRDQMVSAGAADVAGNDAERLRGEIERAIGELSSLSGEGMDPASVDHNPEDHRETLSPDDDTLLDLQDGEEESEADLFGEDYVEEQADGVLDP